MDRRRFPSMSRSLLLARICLVATIAPACAPSRTTAGNPRGTGGVEESGGAVGTGGVERIGSGGSAGDPGGFGGSEPTGLGGAGAGGVEGSGGTTGTLPSCANDSECTNGLVCDTTKNQCVACVSNTSCDAGQECLANQCVASTGDGLSVDLPPPSCTTATATPCTNIPKFAGTQTLDGKGDDMCSVPSFLFSASTAARVMKYNSTPPEEVTARVAWSSAGLLLFADVKDASVKSVYSVDPNQAVNKAYQGDSIEVFISSSNNLTGLTSADNNTLHVIVPAVGPAVSVKTSNSSGSSSGTPTALPATQYRQATTDTGYAIELLLPWPGGAPAAGATVRFDMGLNSADSTFGNADDMRDGQMLYYVGTVTNTTCKSNDGTVPYCDDRTWCATTLQ
jgi:hypothetical protein